MSFRGKTVLFLIFLSFLSYQILLGNKGYLEREELKKSLTQAQFELERIQEENKNLSERKKINLDESRLLEKEARKYYLMRSDSHILKFLQEEGSNESEDRDKKNFWKRLMEDGPSGEKIPPLDVLRVFHISFSIFLILGVYWRMRPEKSEDETDIINNDENSGNFDNLEEKEKQTKD
ncbi:MAG: septum formation initiator family protein [Leptospira sp.]|nr:septum formation initiator family protein [Leptospira sp.]